MIKIIIIDGFIIKERLKYKLFLPALSQYSEWRVIYQIHIYMCSPAFIHVCMLS